MITIEEKLNLFTKIVYDKVERENSQEIKRFEEEYGGLIEEKRNEFKKIAQDMEVKFNEEIEKIKKRTISKAHIEGKKIVLQKKKYIYEMMIEDLLHYADDFTNGEKYKKFLIENLKKTINYYNLDYNIDLYLTKKDLDRFKDEILTINNKLNFLVDDSIHGGFVIFDRKNNVKYDMSLKSIVDSNKELIAERLFALL